jgi:hypothetical protein
MACASAECGGAEHHWKKSHDDAVAWALPEDEAAAAAAAARAAAVPAFDLDQHV